jgi:hypothetical protein
MIMAFVGTIVQYEYEPIGIAAIMPSGSITLEQVAARTAALAVTCTRCDRAGRYNLGALIAGHGPRFGIAAIAVGRLPKAEFDQRV